MFESDLRPTPTACCRRVTRARPGRAGAHRTRAFTLLEVLIALTVLALSLGAALKIATQNSATATYLRDKTQAHWVALNRIAEIQVIERWPAIGVTRGTAELADAEWHWTATISGTPVGDVRRVEVDVRQLDEDHPILATHTAFLAKPR